MDDYLFSGYRNAMGFLQAPQMERERMEDRQRQNAIQDYRLQQARMQAEAEQKEAARLAAAGQRAFQYRGGQMFPGGPRPAQAPQQPMGGNGPAVMPGAAMPPTQPPAPAQSGPVIDENGVEQVTVTGAMLPRPVDPDREEMALIEAAYMAGDMVDFNARFDARRARMTKEEKAGRSYIAASAGQILSLPQAQRHQAVMAMLRQFDIDPADTTLDDYADDPAGLERALRFEMVMGAPDEAAEENIRVDGTQREYRRPEVIDQGRQRTLISTSGTNPGAVLGSYDVTATPGQVLQSETTRRGQDVSAATSRRGQDISSATSIRGQNISAATARRGQDIASGDRARDRAARVVQAAPVGAPVPAGVRVVPDRR